MNAKAVFEQIDLKSHGVIEASAGTGKTYTIENLVVRILCESFETNDPISIEKLLVVTYTEKAAGELKTRIREGIEKKISSLEHTHPLATYLESNLSLFDKANISTIHSFCQKTIQTWAFENNAPLNYELTENSKGLNNAIIQLSKHWSDGDGDGDSNTDCEYLQKIQSLNKRDSLFDKIALLASEMDTDLAKVQSAECTFEELGAEENKLLQQIREKSHTLLEELNPLLPQILAPGLKNNLTKLQSNLERIDELIAAKERGDLTPALVTRYVDTKKAADIKDQVLKFEPTYQTIREGLEKLPEFDLRRTILVLKNEAQKTIQLWNQEKLNKGLFSFNDMIEIVRKSLESEDSLLLRELRSQFTIGIIDEFQDTNPSQWIIFKRIFVDDQKDKLNRKLLLIGDPKQSIYAFQGADVGTYLMAKNILIHEYSAKMYSLNHNFRSTPMMIAAYNHLFSPSSNNWFEPDRQGDETTQIAYTHPVSAGREMEDNDQPYQFSPHFASIANQHLQKPLVIWESSNPETQISDYAQYVAQEIHALIKSDESPILIKENETTRHLNYSDIAILIERRKDAKPFIKALLDSNIPYSFYKEEGIFQSKEFLHFITLLRAVENPGFHDRAIKKSLITPFFNWRLKEILDADRLNDPRGHFSLFDEWKQIADQRDWPKLLNSISSKTNIELILPLFEGGDRSQANFRQITSWFLKHTSVHSGSLIDHLLFMESLYRGEIQVGQDDNYFARETEKSRVQILTMHASKGLEFPVVFIRPPVSETHRTYFTNILNVSEKEKLEKQIWISKVIPESVKQIIKQRKIEEKQRLYYVAFTRAGCKTYTPLWRMFKQDKQTGETFLEVVNTPLMQFTNIALSSNSDYISSSTNNTIPDWEPQINNSAPENAFSFAEVYEEFQAIKNELYQKNTLTNITRYQTSFSGLTKHSMHNQIITGRINKEEEIIAELENETLTLEDNENLYGNLPRSNSTGNLIHDILENMNFEDSSSLAQALKSDSFSLDELPKRFTSLCYAKLHQHISPSKEAFDQCVQETLLMIYHTVFSQIPTSSIELNDEILYSPHKIQENDYRAEAEFHFTFAKDGTPFPPKGQDLKGYILGYIDLLFRVPLGNSEWRYHILDWKTNSLPDYSMPSLQHAMEKSQYTLQAKLYTLALHQWLQTTLGEEYDSAKHLGAPCYVFTRGCRFETQTGIWTPSKNEDWTPTTLSHEIQTLVSQGRFRNALIKTKTGEEANL